eukprot:1741851-Rhodomonas_salina.2
MLCQYRTWRRRDYLGPLELFADSVEHCYGQRVHTDTTIPLISTMYSIGSICHTVQSGCTIPPASRQTAQYAVARTGHRTGIA